MDPADVRAIARKLAVGGRPANQIWLTAEQVAENRGEIAAYEAGEISASEMMHVVARRTVRRMARNHPEDARARRMASWYEGEPD